MPHDSQDDFSADGVRAWMSEQRAHRREEERLVREQRRKERAALHRVFRERQLPPDAMTRVQTLVRRAAADGEREVLAMRFPSDWMTDSGRSVTTGSADWPEKLEGVAALAYSFFVEELQPRGFRVRAVIMEYPEGQPGDVGIYLSWKREE